MMNNPSMDRYANSGEKDGHEARDQIRGSNIKKRKAIVHEDQSGPRNRPEGYSRSKRRDRERSYVL
jgi:hypothetical protein